MTMIDYKALDALAAQFARSRFAEVYDVDGAILSEWLAAHDDTYKNLTDEDEIDAYLDTFTDFLDVVVQETLTKVTA